MLIQAGGCAWGWGCFNQVVGGISATGAKMALKLWGVPDKAAEEIVEALTKKNVELLLPHMKWVQNEKITPILCRTFGWNGTTPAQS